MAKDISKKDLAAKKARRAQKEMLATWKRMISTPRKIGQAIRSMERKSKLG